MALCGLGALAAGWYGKRRLKKNAAAADPSADAANTVATNNDATPSA